MTDVVILAGGLGTRLKGVWDGPKCLAPFRGTPVLSYLLRMIHSEARPRAVALALGHKASEVTRWYFDTGVHLLPRDVLSYFTVEEPKGTTHALCSVLPPLIPPVLVLNGDTVPLYSLFSLLLFHQKHPDVLTVAKHKGVHSGGYVFGKWALRSVQESTDMELSAFAANYGNAFEYERCPFCDVGTPENFRAAQQGDQK